MRADQLPCVSKSPGAGVMHRRSGHDTLASLRHPSLAAGAPQEAPDHGTTESIQGGLKFVVANGIRHIAPMTHGIGRTARRPPVEPARGHDDDIERMPHLEIPPVQKLREGDVLAERLRWQPADRTIGPQRHGKAGPGRHPMIWPGIMRSRIAPCVDFGNQSQIAILEPPAFEEIWPETNDFNRLRIDGAGNAVHAVAEVTARIGKPGGCDHAICVCRQDYALWAIGKALCGLVHCEAARTASGRAAQGQIDFDHGKPVRQQRSISARELRCLIRAIVREQHNLKRITADGRTEAIALHRERSKASFDAPRFVPGRYCNNGGKRLGHGDQQWSKQNFAWLKPCLLIPHRRPCSAVLQAMRFAADRPVTSQ